MPQVDMRQDAISDMEELEADLDEPVEAVAEAQAVAREYLDLDADDGDIPPVNLHAVAQFVKLRDQYQTNPKCKKPSLSASLAIARRLGKGKNGSGKGEGASFARGIRRNELYLLRHQCLPPSKKSARHGQHTLLDNEAMLHGVRRYLAIQKLGTISPQELSRQVNEIIAPTLGLPPGSTITERTAISWLKKLGYQCKSTSKGMYFDGHERPDVVEYRQGFLKVLEELERVMCTYDDVTMEPVPPKLNPGEREVVMICHDEMWLRENEQPIKKKGNGRAIHVSDYICETTGRLALTPAQIAAQEALPPNSRLRSYDARKIIYPGKDHDKWWDLEQLMEQTHLAVDIFEYTNPNKIGLWVFDCSSAHEGLAEDALNVHNMNINLGGKQRHMRDTIIPLSNPPPSPGKIDTRGTTQSMSYPSDHPNPDLAGKAKGMKVVLQERESAWDEFGRRRGGKKLLGKCKDCQMSNIKKDAARRLALAEAMGTDDTISDEVLEAAQSVINPPADDWCCMFRVMSLQEDFVNEKPRIQHYLRWPWERFSAAAFLISVMSRTIRRFFRCSWVYIDVEEVAYQRGNFNNRRLTQ
ncbi:hypothetical protein FIBSPDRAFT_909032 [Athelia psychrophila]|uniref:DDE-1 domain-containing protein n=1 Tax=Athelia psychrophila TaxID=1759441 RepID=A0A166Q945_9AGAM|nr:hypothetical protein FIBSPDRAFT_909032 [Fibularhizoctonia sp. CBS 109695]